MVMTEVLSEKLHVTCARVSCRPASRGRRDDQHQEQRDACECPQRFLRSFASTSSAHASDARACA